MATQKTNQYLQSLAELQAKEQAAQRAPAQKTGAQATGTAATAPKTGATAQTVHPEQAKMQAVVDAYKNRTGSGVTGSFLSQLGQTAKDTLSTGKSQTGPTTVYVGGTGEPAVDPVMAEYANYVAESYARSQPGERPAWNDQWQPQIDALQGGRYGDYQSPYQAKLDGLLDRILGRPDFQYNWSDDPLYRQYAARYQQQARQGMQDAMGQAAGLTGGYGSSYATAAGSQAYGQQMQGLNDRAMELYQLAKDRYDTQGAEMRANMGLLEQREAANRGMYQDDRDTWYGRQDADIANLRNSQLMGWNVYQDAADREMAERQMAWDQYQYWNNIYEAMREQAKKSGGGGGGGRVAASTGTTGTTGTTETQDSKYDQTLTKLRQLLEEQQRRRGANGGIGMNNRVNMDR